MGLKRLSKLARRKAAKKAMATKESKHVVDFIIQLMFVKIFHSVTGTLSQEEQEGREDTQETPTMGKIDNPPTPDLRLSDQTLENNFDLGQLLSPCPSSPVSKVNTPDLDLSRESAPSDIESETTNLGENPTVTQNNAKALLRANVLQHIAQSHKNRPSFSNRMSGPYLNKQSHLGKGRGKIAPGWIPSSGKKIVAPKRPGDVDPDYEP